MMRAREWIEEEYYDDELLLADGFDDAILGVSAHWGGLPKGGCTQTLAVAYDYQKCIEILMDGAKTPCLGDGGVITMEGGMTYEDAVEYLEFNTLGAYVGEHTPVFIRLAPQSGGQQNEDS